MNLHFVFKLSSLLIEQHGIFDSVPVPLLLVPPFVEIKPPLLWPFPVDTEPVTLLLLFC